MFSLRLFLTVAAAAFLAALIAPWIALALAAAGFHFPFPRIFDRVIMVSVAATMWYQARALGLMRRLASGFAGLRGNWPALATGSALAAAVIGAMWCIAFAIGGMAAAVPDHPIRLAGQYLLPALLIGIMEEGFFRAVLLDGMTQDFGPFPALIMSSAIYALAHQIRSPARFELDTLRPLAGFANLGASLARIGWLRETAPAIFGLFLLGLLLGAAFLRTRTVYFSVGLHAGVVAGSKVWRRLAPGPHRLPGWMFGTSGPPLIGGAVAWAAIIVLLVLLRPVTARWTRQPDKLYPV